MLFKTDNVCQKADAKNQMLKKGIKIKMIYQVLNRHKYRGDNLQHSVVNIK